MIVRVSDAQAKAILGSMRDIALAHGPAGVSDADSVTIEAAAKIVLGLDGMPPDLSPCPPDALAGTMSDDEQDGMQAVRMLAVMSLADGNIDEDQIAPFLPYRDGREDPAAAARYEALGELGADTFGRAFWEHFKRNHFAFPGDPNGLAEAFTTHHDSSHVLSSYTTSAPGELLVSTFIGAMHPDHPMAAEVLPALFSYHLGVPMNKIAQVTRDEFEPRSFWTAWERGAATTVDVFDAGWDFWGAAPWPLEELRHEYGVRPVNPALTA